MSLRIHSPTASTEERATALGASNSTDHYMERLVKLVPAESIAAYPLLASLAEAQGQWAIILVAGTLLGVSVVLRWHATTAGVKGPQQKAVAISAVSFVIWVYVMGGSFGLTAMLGDLGEQFQSAKEFLAILALVIWTILIPVFYQGDAD